LGSTRRLRFLPAPLNLPSQRLKGLDVLRSFIARVGDNLCRGNVTNKQKEANLTDATFDQYEESYPTYQNAINAVPGWNTAFPPQFNLQAGTLPLFADKRIRWAIECFGDIDGRRVLELGPLEAGHTAMLVAAGAQVDAIEANKLAFLRCLITKEILGLIKARFYLGDFVKWLEQSDATYDLIVASGVLYHMRDPLRFLRAMAKRSTAIYLWTVCVRGDSLKPAKTESVNGITMRLYEQSYARTEGNKNFCGGMEDRHYWMHRDDILTALKLLGFSTLVIADDEPDNVFGPSFSLFARKTVADDRGVTLVQAIME
jgi:hypothetical protein